MNFPYFTGKYHFLIRGVVLLVKTLFALWEYIESGLKANIVSSHNSKDLPLLF